MPYLKGAIFRVTSDSGAALERIDRLMMCACLDGPPDRPCLIRQTPLRSCFLHGSFQADQPIARVYHFEIGYEIRPDSFVQVGVRTDKRLHLDKPVQIAMQLIVTGGDAPPERSLRLV